MNDIPKEVVKAIKSGIGSEFWLKGLSRVLQDYVNELTDKITGDTPMKEDETRDGLILERRAYKTLLTLPESILEEEEKPKPKEPEGIPGDPYQS